MTVFTNHTTDNEGYLKTLDVDGTNILTKWGIEFSDSEKQFIHGQKAGANHHVESSKIEKNRTRTTLMVDLKRSRIRLEIDEHFSPDKIERKFMITPLEDTNLIDIAISQAFIRETFTHAKINGNIIGFDGMERNHQFESKKAILVGKSFDLEVELKVQANNSGLAPVVYCRTGKRFGWSIHTRLFPKEITKKVIIWCNKHWNRSIPLSNFFSSIRPVVDYLWYVGERPDRVERRTFGFASFGMAHAPKNETIVLTQCLTLVQKNSSMNKNDDP
ncbi:MAG: hypothetical protein IPJ89_02810 [Candidatus Iainarchaeum archaeon]|uniref:Uncharacterized protein n=1 Tax=Candidatus Iainarchaeum sp. TaxID=3101447 RepID=A0A7T9I297_9ARCH|nr:MAG: hypothetical protein IPJ89_02810 [Candidatus Diapherotrites archaeon]